MFASHADGCFAFCGLNDGMDYSQIHAYATSEPIHCAFSLFREAQDAAYFVGNSQGVRSKEGPLL